MDQVLILKFKSAHLGYRDEALKTNNIHTKFLEQFFKNNLVSS